MNEVSVRQLQRMSSQEICQRIPFLITCDKTRIAIVLSTGVNKALFELDCLAKNNVLATRFERQPILEPEE